MTDISSMFDVVFSYGAGFAGSLVYMRMLGNTVDSMADGAKGLIKYEKRPSSLSILYF